MFEPPSETRDDDDDDDDDDDTKLNVSSWTQDVALLSEGVSPPEPDPDPDPERPYVVPLHLRPDLVVPCADLVNCEWQRSRAARVHALHKSRPQFPVCLVLLLGHEETEQLLGHARLSRVVGHVGSLFVESVVVSRAQRGRGYGRTLMEETERYARSRGFTRLCLTTHDKQRFYAHLGYQLTTPVQNAGAMTTFVTMETLLRLSGTPGQSVSADKKPPSIRQAPPPPPSIPKAPPPLPSIPKAPPPPPSIPKAPPPSIYQAPPPSIPQAPPPPPPSILQAPPPPRSIPQAPPPPSIPQAPPPPLPSIPQAPPPPPPSIPKAPPPSIYQAPPPPSIPMAPPPPSIYQAPPPPPPSILQAPPPPRSIPQAPPPPPPSIPQAPPPPSIVVQTLNETPYRDAKGLPIFWMHKNL